MSQEVTLRTDEGFTPEQVEIIRSQVAPPGTTNEELAMFLMYCQRTGLDPFARQIYLSERRSKDQRTGNWTVTRKPETTIDGFRLIAERTGKYAGQLGPFWCGEDGTWNDVWLSREPPMAAKVGILRHDFKEPLWGVALYSEYVQTKADGQPNSMWSKMPANQLAKCAESLANRKAFPRELSGMYSKEEMGQADDARQSLEETRDRRISEEQKKRDAVDWFVEVGPQDVPQPQLLAVAAPKAAENPKGKISFKALEGFKAIKAAILKHTKSEAMYYEVLGMFFPDGGVPYTKSNQIQDDKQGKEIYKAMASALRRSTAAKDLLDTLSSAHAVVGDKPFNVALETYGCKSPQDVLLLDGTSLDALLTELKALSDATRMPVFDSKEWPDSFDGPACMWNGTLYRYNEEAGAYRKAD